MYTQEQIDKRTSDYVCFSCGLEFLTTEQKETREDVVTCHEGTCGLCGHTTTITHRRHFNYLQIQNENANRT